MSKLGWVLLPLLLAAVWLGWCAWRGRPVSRPVANAVLSLLLLFYVAATAALGIFWVANQHLPVFDWHYVFGYATVLLLAVHLVYNLHNAWRALAGRRAAAPASARPTAPSVARRPLLAALGITALTGSAFWLGLRQGRSDMGLAPLAASATGGEGGALALVERFHALSGHSRSGVLAGAPGVVWGDPPPPFKMVAALEVRPLPRAQSGSMPAPPGSPLTAPLLGHLLWHCAGVNLRRGTIHFRTAPSSGALFASEFYVVLAQPLPDLAAGVWHYDPANHALRRLGDVSAPFAATPGAPAQLVATALFRRSGHKYRDRAYRYVLADLGHALENVRAVAHDAALPLHFARTFDESRVAAALGIDEAEEGVLAWVALGPRGWSSAAAPAASAAPPRSAWDAAAPAAAVALGVTSTIHRATSLREAGAEASAPDASAPTSRPGETPRALPPPQVHRLGAAECIAQRRSVRRFSAAPLSAAQLSALCDAALRRHAAVYGGAVRLYVLTTAVAGWPPTAWRYRPDVHGLVPLGAREDGLRDMALRAALDQDVAADAAVVFVLSIDRATFAADAAGPARGYRHAFLDAGVVGERLYLEGTALGLGVCGVGAFYDDELAALAGVDAGREWVVHLVAVGLPA